MEDRGIDCVTIVCKGGECIEWSRSQLSRYCGYFRVLLYGNFVESTKGKMHFQDVKANTLKDLLNFCAMNCRRVEQCDDPQFSRIPFEDAYRAADIMRVADMLGMDQAVLECERYFLQTRDLYNQADLFHLAEVTSSHSIMREIVRDQEIAEIDKGVSNTCVGCVYEGAKYDVTETIYITGGYCYENVTDCVSVSLHDFRVEVEDCVVVRKPDTSSQSKLPNSNSFKYKASYVGPESEEYRVVALHTDVYMTGGYDVNARATNRVWKYDTRMNKWSRVSAMRRSRFSHCIASIGQHMYVCGGFDDNFVVNTLERYHPHYNEWVDLCAMPIGVGSAAHASDETGIYTCCGQYGYKEFHTINDVQYYQVSTDDWSILTTYDSPVFYPQSEYGQSAAVLERDFIVFGGQTARCDAFNFDSKKWRRLSDMKRRRMETGRVVVRDKLYSVGGYDYKTGEYQNTVEQYDRKMASWEILETTLPKSMRSMGVCYVFDVELQTPRKHLAQAPQ